MIITVTMNPSVDCSVTVDKLRTGEVNRALGFQTEAGGKGVNVSKLLTNLGCENIAVGFAGADNFNEYKKLLDRAGIKHDFLTVPGSTRTNIKISDSQGATTDINGAGITVGADDVHRLFELMDGYLTPNSAVVISGSLGGGTRPETIGDLIRFCASKGARTVADTSGDALRTACCAKPWAVKPNIHELEDLCGRALDTTAKLKSAAEELIKSGIQTVVVSLGDKGLIYVSEKTAYLSPGLSVDVKCTVGAGDAVTAAIAMGIINGADDETILRYAAACGTAAVTMPGSTMPDRETTEQYLNRIGIIEI